MRSTRVLSLAWIARRRRRGASILGTSHMTRSVPPSPPPLSALKKEQGIRLTSCFVSCLPPTQSVTMVDGAARRLVSHWGKGGGGWLRSLKFQPARKTCARRSDGPMAQTFGLIGMTSPPVRSRSTPTKLGCNLVGVEPVGSVGHAKFGLHFGAWVSNDMS